MRWPWRSGGSEEDAAADERLRRAKELAAKAHTARANKRTEIEKNHFTELFLEALQRRQA